MGKVIAVDERFGNLIKELEVRGYVVVNLYKQGVPVDVCVYYDSMKDFKNVNPYLDTGVLMINGKDKSIDDIELIIERGIYSSLF